MSLPPPPTNHLIPPMDEDWQMPFVQGCALRRAQAPNHGIWGASSQAAKPLN